MRSEARSLEALLEVLSQRIGDSQARLGTMAERLMGLGDETTGQLGARHSRNGHEPRTARRSTAMRSTAQPKRRAIDIGVLLDDLPRAEATARAVADQLRAIGSDTSARTADLAQQVARA